MFDPAGHEAIDDSGDHIERQQHPDEPGGPDHPGADGHRLPPECGEADFGMKAQLDRIVSDRHQDHRADDEGKAEAPAAVAQKPARPLAL
jgi:hypothetical protein